MKTQPILSALEWLQNDLPRAAGVPVAHLMGYQRFMGLDMQTSSDVLIPRKETELLGATSLTLLRRITAERGTARVLDLCTGSGNLAVAMAVYDPGCSIVATDISEHALALARSNAKHYRVDDRIQFFRGDLFEALPAGTDAFDLVVCNPPYIPSSRLDDSELIVHEPRTAFDGGPFGLSIVTRVIEAAHRHLRPDSWLCIEVGRGQGEFVVGLLERGADFGEVAKYVDAGRDIRVVAARKAATAETGS
jgi:release factor glutamine methyltransferase